MQDTKTQSITFRTTKELKAALQYIADTEKRSLSVVIEMILENAVKAKKKK